MKKLLLLILFYTIPLLSFCQVVKIQTSAYTTWFDTKLGIPRAVEWTLTKNRLERNSNRHSYSFTQYPGVSGQATNGDYSKSGYDRGHMCPAGDCLWSGQAMKESFWMINVVPQRPNLNRDTWEKLEQACRDSVLVYDSLVIRAGIYVGSPLGKLGKGNILIPSRFYKRVTYWRNGKSYTKRFIFKNE